MTTPPGPVTVHGPEALRLATVLLQRMRRERPAGTIWEAADVQWWSRQDRPTDREGQLFWLDERGEPTAAALATDFGHSVQHDVLTMAKDHLDLRLVWRAAIAKAAATRGAGHEFPVHPADTTGAAELTAAGYQPAPGPGVITSWLDAARRPAIPPLAGGYRLLSRADDPGRPYPLAARNGAQAELRLRRCSLYRPELDLMVAAPDGEPAGYGLFWADPVTGVGLVEPMRTEHAHQNRGIASHILATGLSRLAAHGCRRLKVSNDLGIYLRAGFEPARAVTAPVWTRSAAG
jgi:GNAT superfamily N-acetyltransferase